jgi:MFS transporter, ACS family, hexuronate transporter
MSQKGFWTYENVLLSILALSFGFAFFDRNAVSYLTTFLVRDPQQGGLGLSNAQVGQLGAALSFTWAVSAVAIGRWSDAVGARKPFLVGILLVFSVCSVISGLANSFYTLLVSRLIMGLAEGPLMPICLAILTAESSPHRRGLNIGIVQSLFSSLIGATIAPLILVKLAIWSSWRVAFFISGVPGVLCALAIMRFVREPETPAKTSRPELSPAGSEEPGLFSQRNIGLCAGIACLMVSWLMLHQMFLPLFLNKIRNLTEQQGSWIMSATGLCATLTGFIAAGISDRIGRKPVVVTACLLSLLTPLAALYFHGPLFILAALMFVGWVGTSAFALFMAVIPGETLPLRYAATATGVVASMGEIAGGGLQVVGGWIADLTTRAAPIQIAALCAIGGTILAFFLKETAPVKTGVISGGGKSWKS